MTDVSDEGISHCHGTGKPGAKIAACSFSFSSGHKPVDVGVSCRSTELEFIQ